MTVIFIACYYNKIDKKLNEVSKNLENIKEIEEKDCTTYYLFLPVIQLVLVAIFSFINSIKIDVVTVNIISFIFVFILEIIRYKNCKKVAQGVDIILESMDICFDNIVSNFLAQVKGGLLITMFLMSLITFGAVILLGSGNASWYAFGALVAEIAKQMGISSLYIALPMQLSTAIDRTLSPVAGVVIAVAGLAKVEVKDLIKHSLVPIIVAFITNIILNI